MSQSERSESDGVLLRRFMELPQVAASKTLLLFWGMGAEPETERLFAPLSGAGKVIGLPRCLPGGEMEFRRWEGEGRITRHSYGMREPDLTCPVLDPYGTDLVLVPAMCYDETCLRLGRGGGFYDRFLARYRGETVGLCRERLLQHRCPGEAHDQRVRLVITERRVIRQDPT